MLSGWFKKHLGLFLVISLSWWTIKPLFHSGFFPMHDDAQVVRVYEITQALRDGQFPVRWVADLGYGYGYPLFNFYAPLPYYVGALSNLIGFDALVSTKFMFGMGIFLSGVFMYFLAREFFGELGGLTSAVFYQYAPYHAVDIYIRGAVGEFYAVAFLPLVAYGLYKLYQKSNQAKPDQKHKPKIKNIWLYIIIGSLGYAGVILSHSITAMLLTGFIFIASLLHCFIVFVFLKEKKVSFSLLTSYFSLLILGLGVSAFFWLPALVEARHTNVEYMIREESNFREHFLYLDQLWDSPWGFGGSARGRADGMSFKIGKLHLILAILGIVSLLALKTRPARALPLSGMARDKSSLGFPCFFVSLLGFSVFMTTGYSRFIWEVIPLLPYVQYPWRFLVFIIFSLSFFGGANRLLLHKILTKKYSCAILSKVGVLLITGLVIFINAKYFQPQKFLNVSVNDYLNEENIKWKTSKISDEYLPKDFPKPQTPEKIVREKVTVESGVRILNQKIKTHRYEFLVDSNKPHNIFIHTAYFPGWEVLLDGAASDFRIVNEQILIPVPLGRHDLVIQFSNTPVRTLANLISLLSLAFLTVKAIQVKNINQNRFMPKRNIEITIPVYNEEKELQQNILKLYKFAKDKLKNYQWHLTIVDNASFDRTHQLGKELEEKYKEISFVRLKRKGRGQAVKKIWRKSKADILSYMDLDLSTDLKHFPSLLKALHLGYDIAIGSRLLPGSKVLERTFKREFVSRAYNLLIKLLFQTKFSDAQCGFKAVKKEVVEQLLPHVRDNDWFMDSELLIIAEKLGYKIYEEPVTWRDNPGSTVRVLPTAIGDLKGLLRLLLNRPWNMKP